MISTTALTMKLYQISGYKHAKIKLELFYFNSLKLNGNIKRVRDKDESI